MLTRFTALLDEFRQLPLPPEPLPTLMEIAGYPHYENVCSNILAFFLEPGRPHGLGTLFLDAIAQIGAIQNQGEAIDSNISVDREARTDAGNRIDILVQSDSHVILIENKIFAGVDNPFCDYAAYAEALEPAGRHINKFLLTLTPNNAGADHGFRNVTHGQLVHKIRELLGHYIAGADTRYLTFMLDFLHTLHNLQGGMVMIPEFVRFLAQRRDEVETFLAETRNFRGELRSKVERLRELIDINDYPNVGQSLWRSGDDPLVDILVHDITIANGLVHNVNLPFVVAIDTMISPEGWRVELFPRHDERNPDRQAALRNLLQNLNIPFEEGGRLTVWTCPQYGRDLKLVAKTVRKIVLRLANAA